jgi:hypothetical protein
MTVRRRWFAPGPSGSVYVSPFFLASGGYLLGLLLHETGAQAPSAGLEFIEPTFSCQPYLRAN